MRPKSRRAAPQIATSCTVVAFISVETPFPNVPAQIEEAYRIRLEASNGQRCRSAPWSRLISSVVSRRPLFTPRKFEVYEFWPGDFFASLEQAGIPRRVPPPFLPETGSELASRAGQKPMIVSPNSKENSARFDKNNSATRQSRSRCARDFLVRRQAIRWQSRTGSGSRVDRSHRRLRTHRAGRSWPCRFA